MIGEYYIWRKMKNSSIFQVEDMLCDLEDDYVFACGRFLSRDPSKDTVWTLNGKRGELSALIINSRSTVIPVFYGRNEIPKPKFLGSSSVLKKIHSVQGLRNEVELLEAELNQFGRNISEIFDYDLMNMDTLPANAQDSKVPGLLLRVPRMSDLDELAPLQTAYEQEEVLHKGSVFSPAASRINLGKIIADRKILAAEINGRLIGKININAVSFTRYMIGGVYVHPDFRGLGIARRMASQFITSLMNEGEERPRGITLFVKKSNLAARRLYLGLGFKIRGDYRITYYSS